MTTDTHIPPTTDQALSVAEARSLVDDARARLATAVTDYRAAREGFDKIDREKDSTTRASSSFVLAEYAARQQLLDSAQDLAASRSAVVSAKEALTTALGATYTSGLAGWKAEKHSLAVKADKHLVALADLLSDLRQLHLQELTARDAAGVAGPNTLRFDKVVASSIVRQLAGAAPALRDTLGSTPYRVRGLAAIFTDPKST